MEHFKKPNVTSHGVNNKPTVLRSDEDYERWYMKQFDFSMFTEIDAKKAMEDERPDYYPCIPLFQAGSYDVMYLEEDLVKLWFLELYKVTLSPI